MIIRFGGHDIELLAERALWLPETRLLCVADLHLGKDSFFAAFATFLPPYGSLETLDRLEALIDRLRPATLIAAGDSFHDRGAAARLPSDLLDRLNALTGAVDDWHWLSGNHDPELSERVRGRRGVELAHNGLVFRHQATGGTDMEISGHFHPKTRFKARGHSFSLPCFVRQGTRLILPSFGQYTGGLDIDSAAFRAIAPAADRVVYAAHRDRVFLIDGQSAPHKMIENLR